MSAENIALLSRFFQEVVQGRDPESARVLCTPGYAHHDPTLAPQEIHGLERYLEAAGLAAPGTGGKVMMPEIVVKDIAAAGDKVAVVWARRDGGSAPANFISTHRIADGKIAESWVYEQHAE